MQTVDIAIFPIPNMACFPGYTFPLHVFEPRYRSLVKDSVGLGRPVAICHTKKVLAKAKPNQSMAEKLNKNQATYEPQAVFSAGPCEIKEVTEDGRILADVNLQKRYRIINLKQQVPYMVAECEEYNEETDKPPTQNNKPLVDTVKALHQFLIEVAQSDYPDLMDVLATKHWNDMTPEEFSHRFFDFVRFEGDLMQELLEANYQQRLLRLQELISPPSL